MASEIKVDTISEKTSANGVTIDSLSIKDGGLIAEGNIDVNGNNLVLDANANTYLDAGTDDTIKVYVAGAHDLTISANAVNVLSGTTLTIDSGATIANSGTATGFSSADPASADGDTLGTASLEWSDLYLADSSVIYFGADQDTTLTHTDGTGLTLNSTNKLCFNDATQFIQGASGTVLDIAATDEIELTATLLDVNANLDVSGTSLLPTLGVITAKDLGVGVHIRTSDTGASVHANADEFVIEQEGHAGMTILSADASLGSIMFGDSGSNVDGGITYDHNTLEMAFQTGNGGEVFRLSNDGQLSTRGETAPDVDNGGATLNHGGDDGAIMTFKNSDVAHGITGHYETDTYGIITKKSNSQGGFMLRGYSETGVGFEIKTVMGNGEGSTAKSTSADGNMQVDGYQHDGSAGGQAMPSNTNIAAWKNATDTQVIFDIEGEIHSNGGAQSAYDEYDDAQLIRTFDLSRGRGTIDSKFDKFIAYNHEHLAEMKLVGREDDGTPNHFINVTGFQRLHNGAIWQQYEKHQQLLEAVYDLAKEAVGKEKADAILEKHEVKRLQ